MPDRCVCHPDTAASETYATSLEGAGGVGSGGVGPAQSFWGLLWQKLCKGQNSKTKTALKRQKSQPA